MGTQAASLEQLVIDANPGAQITYQIAQQLNEHLPLRTADQFRQCLGRGGLKIGNTSVKADQILRSMPERVFPIEDTRDLVSKVAAAIRTGIEILARSGKAPRDEELARLAAILVREPVAVPKVATGYFGGPSLFGGK
ncbi:MAG: hypothetical protein KDD47_24240 [Acidobacteria bacterium]|nr:hypothetical protein [Acidobacteriota bacterium]